MLQLPGPDSNVSHGEYNGPSCGTPLENSEFHTPLRIVKTFTGESYP